MKSLKKILVCSLVLLFYSNITFAQMPVTKNEKELVALDISKSSAFSEDSQEKIRKDEIRLQDEKNRVAQLKENLEANSVKKSPLDEVMDAKTIMKNKANIEKRERAIKAFETSLQIRKQKLAGTKEE